MGPISFHPLAERELNDTTRYYNLESPGLGRAFLDAVRKTCASITEHPQAGAAVVGTILRRLIRRFPYALLYSVRSDRVRILAVMSLKRRPMYWVGRE
jgi:plasmid stabilization system protein ParE